MVDAQKTSRGVAQSKWIWMPHPAHLIVGNDCRFHVATVVGKFIVSTVGEYWPDSAVREILASTRNVLLEGIGDARAADYFRKLGYESIGCGRLYETMVFPAKRNHEAEHQCCPYEPIHADGELDMQGYNDAPAAMRGHLALCRKWAKHG